MDNNSLQSKFKDNNESDFNFEDFFQVQEIQEMQNSFSAATGVASLITYPDGKPITIQTLQIFASFVIISYAEPKRGI